MNNEFIIANSHYAGYMIFILFEPRTIPANHLIKKILRFLLLKDLINNYKYYFTDVLIGRFSHY